MYFVFEIKFSNLCKCVRKKDITQNFLQLCPDNCFETQMKTGNFTLKWHNNRLY